MALYNGHPVHSETGNASPSVYTHSRATECHRMDSLANYNGSSDVLWAGRRVVQTRAPASPDDTPTHTHTCALPGHLTDIYGLLLKFINVKSWCVSV